MEYAHLALPIAGVIKPESILRALRASNHKSFVDKMYGINVRDKRQDPPPNPAADAPNVSFYCMRLFSVILAACETS